MLKQQTVVTALGSLTVSSLTLGELRQLESIFQGKPDTGSVIAGVLRYLPALHKSVQKVHQDITIDWLENGLTFDDFNDLFSAVLEVSGLKKAAPAGEASSPAAAPV